MRALLVVVVAGLALAACAEGGEGGEDGAGREPAGAAAPLTTVARGSDGPFRGGEVVARSAAEWQAAWVDHGGRGDAPAVGPEVDFDARMVVAVFGGQRPSAGFEVLVEGADAGAGGLEVRYASVSPGPDCFTASVITFPFHVVAVGRTDGRVTFRAEERVKRCGP